MRRLPKSLESYLLAVLAVGVAIALRVPVWPILGSFHPYLTLWPAVLLASYKGGIGPGLVAVGGSVLAAAYFMLEPTFSLATVTPTDVVGLIYFVLLATAIVWVAQQARRARADAERQRTVLRCTLASIGDAIIATDVDARVAFLNPVAEEITGWTMKEAAGRPIREIFAIRHEHTDVAAENPIERVLREATVVALANHTVLITRDGKRIPIDDSGAPIRGESGEILGAVLVFRDVSNRRATELEVRKSREQLVSTLESISDAFFALNAEWRFTYVNRAAAALLRHPREEIVGKLYWDLVPYAKGGELEARMQSVLQTGESCAFEFQSPRSEHWYEMNVYPGADDALSVYFRDITSRKQAEAAVRRAHEEFQHFTYGASHDLKEPLRMVTSYAQLLTRRYRGQLDQDADEYLRYILDGVQRLRELVDAIIEYSRAGEVTADAPQCTNAETALRNSLLSLQSSIESTGASITSDSLPDVAVRELHLTQVFQNLIGNAINYRSSAPPTVHVSSRCDNGCCTFAVRDNGIGIAPQDRERVFGLFQRLHGRERPGSGLGLATCKRVVERYGGKIWVESSGEGSGSTFYFTLPLPD